MRIDLSRVDFVGVDHMKIDLVARNCRHQLFVPIPILPFQALQNFMYTMLKDSSAVAAKMSLVRH